MKIPKIPKVEMVSLGSREHEELLAWKKIEMEACEASGGHDFDWNFVYTTYPPMFECRRCRHKMSARTMRQKGIQPVTFDQKTREWVPDPDDYGVPLG